MLGLSKVILADDHALVREGLKLLLSVVEGFTVVGEAADGDAVERLLKEVAVELLVLDLGMPGVNGFQFIKNIRTAWPNVKILVVTANLEPRSVRAAIDAGADGYLTKSGDATEFMAAITALQRGEVYVAEDVRFAVGQQRKPDGFPEPKPTIASPVDLTRRERQMLALIPHGVTTRDIAERLGISPLTARKHRENLMRKLDLHSGAELTAYAIRLGLPAG
ncbi:response regulator [Phyllobacterium myrsinacearum]|uniref:DNA-binding NarL/FixJ family response regulator n=1 Tax=Phyllobacterium myrsinacearum TaxID=28101 RepID=A0A839ERA3_9HYPH|nr:response regulator transcription factor [Phyllobacterium myrsinacearum]MBA8878977.1 DNA-binding NarL/FixJ family response regulator [Phyllobacterium myrsinacearum]